MSFNYFNTLNYTLANEDTSLEMNILPQGVGHVLSVAGSGSRVLPLFSKLPSEMTCVDLSKEQLYLTELRIEAARVFDLEDFLSFFGYPPRMATPESRKKMFEKIKLTPEAKAFLLALFQELGWASLLYMGRWERTFQKIAKANKYIIGKKALGLFDCQTLEEQARFLEAEFSRKRWEIAVKTLGNSAVFKSFLYQSSFPKMNVAKTHYDFYKAAFDRLFAHGPARENYFLQIVFFGSIQHEEANPIECQRSVFEGIKKGISNCTINYVQGNVIEQCALTRNKPLDFVSISDVPSYFSMGLGRTFLQSVRKGLSEGGQIVCRYYLHTPAAIDTAGYSNVSHMHEQGIKSEKTQMYLVDVMKKTA